MDSKAVMENAIANLVNAIKNSKEYEEYIKEKNCVSQYPDLKEKIDDFRFKNYAMQNDKNTNYETIEQFEKQYADLHDNPMVTSFLEAELAFCRMMQSINIEVATAIEFE